MVKRPRIKRVLLKVSGEVLGGEHTSLDFDAVESFAAELKGAKETGAEIAVVIGGGNIVRGAKASSKGVDRVIGDYMGILGTIINALALESALDQVGVDSRVMTSIRMEQFADHYIRRKALASLEEGRLIILAGGTGNPYFTTDTAAALRAVEINADALLKGTKVDGVFDKDPVENEDAKLIERISHTEVLKEGLGVMDATSVALCRDNNIPIIVFNLFKKGNLKKVLEGETLGSIVQ